MSTPTPHPLEAAAAPTVLVLGATGLMGREVVRALRAHGVEPRVLVRDPARLASTDGLDVRVGDLRDRASLRSAVAGVDVVFHLSPHEPDEVELTRAVIEISVLLLGWTLGGTFGVGTVVFALAIGPLVQIFLGRWNLATARGASQS